LHLVKFDSLQGVMTETFETQKNSGE